MALIKCPECSREISDKAEICPQCAFPIASYLKKMKAEQLEADNFKAERIRFKKQQEHLIQFEELKNKDGKKHLSGACLRIKTKYKFIASVILAVVAFSVYTTNKNIKATEEAKHQQEIVQKRISFNEAKSLINKNSLSRNDLEKVKTSLASVDESMPEYKEAIRLLNDIIHRINKWEYAQTQKAEKERKEAENAKFTPGGRRLHSKHPEWDAEDCNAIAKGHIGIGMTKEQVAAAWGRPYKVNKSQYGSGGIQEQWVINEMGSSYVYFEDGICTAIQN